MEYTFLEEIKDFRRNNFREEKCRFHFKNDTILCCHWGYQFQSGKEIQMQCINCIKCGRYVHCTNVLNMTLENICNCHSRFKKIKLFDLSDSVELIESIEVIESNDLFNRIKSNSLDFFYEGDSNEDFLQ